jgi:hypothetical protein
MCKGPAEDNCVVNDKQPDSDDEEVWLLSLAGLACCMSPVLLLSVAEFDMHKEWSCQLTCLLAFQIAGTRQTYCRGPGLPMRGGP